VAREAFLLRWPEAHALRSRPEKQRKKPRSRLNFAGRAKIKTRREAGLAILTRQRERKLRIF
jgi:hypothetical protein